MILFSHSLYSNSFAGEGYGFDDFDPLHRSYNDVPALHTEDLYDGEVPRSRQKRVRFIYIQY